MFFLFVAVHIGISLVDDVIDIAERRLTDDIAKGSAGSMGLEMFLDAPQMEAVFLFFPQYDAFGGKYLANLGEHMRNALIWVFFADSKIYRVIDRDMLQVCWFLSMSLLRKLLDIYAIRENVVMAVPGNQ